MSRQNKARRTNLIKKQFSDLRKSGGKGPASTVKVHKKKNCWYHKRKLASRDTTSESVQEKLGYKKKAA